MSPWLVLSLPLLIAAVLVFRHVLKRWKRKQLLNTPLTHEQRAVVERLTAALARLG